MSWLDANLQRQNLTNNAIRNSSDILKATADTKLKASQNLQNTLMQFAGMGFDWAKMKSGEQQQTDQLMRQLYDERKKYDPSFSMSFEDYAKAFNTGTTNKSIMNTQQGLNSVPADTRGVDASQVGGLHKPLEGGWMANYETNLPINKYLAFANKLKLTPNEVGGMRFLHGYEPKDWTSGGYKNNEEDFYLPDLYNKITQNYMNQTGGIDEETGEHKPNYKLDKEKLIDTIFTNAKYNKKFIEYFTTNGQFNKDLALKKITEWASWVEEDKLKNDTEKKAEKSFETPTAINIPVIDQALYPMKKFFEPLDKLLPKDMQKKKEKDIAFEDIKKKASKISTDVINVFPYLSDSHKTTASKYIKNIKELLKNKPKNSNNMETYLQELNWYIGYLNTIFNAGSFANTKARKPY